VTTFGPTLASSVAGAPQAERQAVERSSREERDRARARKASERKGDTHVDEVELTDAVRNLKDNTQEETHDDREEHPQYGVGGKILHRTNDEGPSLDIEG
jgi:hypothetical protein